MKKQEKINRIEKKSGRNVVFSIPTGKIFVGVNSFNSISQAHKFYFGY